MNKNHYLNPALGKLFDGWNKFKPPDALIKLSINSQWRCM